MKFLKKYISFFESTIDEIKPLSLNDFSKLKGQDLINYLNKRLSFLLGSFKTSLYIVNRLQDYEYDSLTPSQKENYINNYRYLSKHILDNAPLALIKSFLNKRIHSVLNTKIFNSSSTGLVLNYDEFDKLDNDQLTFYIKNIHGTARLPEEQLDKLNPTLTDIYLNKRINALKKLNNSDDFYTYNFLKDYEFDKMNSEQVELFTKGENNYTLTQHQVQKTPSDNISLDYLVSKFNGRHVVTETQFHDMNKGSRGMYYMQKRKEFIFNLENEEEVAETEYTYFTDYELSRVNKIEFGKYIKTGFPIPANQLSKLNEKQLETYFTNRFRVQYDGEHNDGSLSQKPIEDYEFDLMNDKQKIKFVNSGNLDKLENKKGLSFILTPHQLNNIDDKLSEKYFKYRIDYVEEQGYYYYYLYLHEIERLFKLNHNYLVKSLQNYSNGLKSIDTDEISSYPSKWTQDYKLEDNYFIKVGLMLDYVNNTNNIDIIAWCYSFITSFKDSISILYYIKNNHTNMWDKFYDLNNKTSMDTAVDMGEMGF